MGAAIWLVESTVAGDLSSAGKLVVGILVGAGSYALVIHLASPSAYSELRRLTGIAVKR